MSRTKGVDTLTDIKADREKVGYAVQMMKVYSGFGDPAQVDLGETWINRRTIEV
jgi:hypothetical protein